MKILFICTHNRCRSILSEAICNHLAGAQLQGFSAGSQPVGEVHPLSLKYLDEHGISTEGLRSKSWHEFENNKPDIAITVCDSAANEACPVWFGDCVTLHWGLQDPSKLQGSDAEIKSAFYNVMSTIEQRVHALLALNLADRPQTEWRNALARIIQEVK